MLISYGFVTQQISQLGRMYKDIGYKIVHQLEGTKIHGKMVDHSKRSLVSASGTSSHSLAAS